ncbi:hypothetical protein [Methylocystis parvus]|uniref:hypothetical protein n=1 Tax=Methylocystis parvus TaxID=134 RepID=UPI003C78282D
MTTAAESAVTPARAPLPSGRAFALEKLDQIVAEQLSADERRALTIGQARAVALVRLGLTIDEAAKALGLKDRHGVASRLDGAARRGVSTQARRACGAPGIDGPKTVTRIAALDLAATGRLTRGKLATIVAEQLSDEEFERLSPRQAEAVAQRRLRFNYAEMSDALDLGQGPIATLLCRARDKGVEP